MSGQRPDDPSSTVPSTVPSSVPSSVPSTVPSTASGPGRVLVLVYAVFALAASARAGVQLLRDWHEAPVAYGLSALAAVVYVLATVGLARGWRRLAAVAVSVELIGVLVVGAASLADPAAFPRATVWSGFGQGYGYVPLVLPIVGLLWLRRTAGPPTPATGSGS